MTIGDNSVVPGGCSAAEGELPTEFDETKNIAWKTELPAKGASSPIIVGDKVFCDLQRRDWAEHAVYGLR